MNFLTIVKGKTIDVHRRTEYNIMQITLCCIMHSLADRSFSNAAFHTLPVPSVNIFEDITVSFQSPMLKSDF